MTLLPSVLMFAFVHYSLSGTIVQSKQRSFEIDYKNDVFLKDGEPFHYISGSLHYFQVPRAYWRDRLRKYRAAGLNTISTYIEWKSHEPLKGRYDFSDNNDFEYFLKLAQDEGLLVILRPGPYIDAERDFGGYPPWLLHENPKMALRSNDSSHTKYVYSWLSVLFPRVQPLLYGNGGPVIMVQVENEFGSFYCDRTYTSWLRDVFQRYVGNAAVLFTTDGQGDDFMKCGPIPGVFATIDFFVDSTGNIKSWFEPLRKVRPHGPLVNSEMYVGWLSHWGKKAPNWPGQGYLGPTVDDIKYTLRQFLSTNASFNLYLLHGGTNFGLTSGANYQPYLPQVTSYDFGAPISESGNLTEKYFAIKDVISEFVKIEDVKIPIDTPADYGRVKVEPKISLINSGTGVNFGTFSTPKTFESLQLYSGFMLYETALTSDKSKSKENTLQVGPVHDRTIVFLDKQSHTVINRTDGTSSVTLPPNGSVISFLVENQGHIAYPIMGDLKGLLGNVTLNGDTLGPWTHTGYPMSDVSSIPGLPSAAHVDLPAFYCGSFQLPDPGQPSRDTFVDMTGWGKGILYVNDYNLGRYWPSLGPQITLYLPAPFLKKENVFVILELERENPNRTISLIDKPKLNETLSFKHLSYADFSVGYEKYAFHYRI